MSPLSSLLRPVIATVFSNFFQILRHLGNIFALGIIRIRIPDIGLPHPSTLACLRSARHAKISLFHRDKISIDCFGDKIVAGTIIKFLTLPIHLGFFIPTYYPTPFFPFSDPNNGHIIQHIGLCCRLIQSLKLKCVPLLLHISIAIILVWLKITRFHCIVTFSHPRATVTRFIRISDSHIVFHPCNIAKNHRCHSYLLLHSHFPIEMGNLIIKKKFMLFYINDPSIYPEGRRTIGLCKQRLSPPTFQI